MTSVVLDASALLALLLGEPGSDRVRAVIADCSMTTVNIGEVVGHYARAGSSETDIRLALDPLPIERTPIRNLPRTAR
jgi:ribonuclease VapC